MKIKCHYVNCLFSGSSYIWLYCGTVLLDKGPHVLRDWWVCSRYLTEWWTDFERVTPYFFWKYYVYIFMTYVWYTLLLFQVELLFPSLLLSLLSSSCVSLQREWSAFSRMRTQGGAVTAASMIMFGEITWIHVPARCHGTGRNHRKWAKQWASGSR